MATQLFGQRRAVVHVRSHGDQIGMSGQFFRMAYQGGDLVAAIQGFLQQRRADVTAGADQGEFHGECLGV